MSAAEESPSPEVSGPLLLRCGYPWDGQIAEFFGANHRLLRRYLMAQGCSASDSDDIAQDAFLIVRERWETVGYYDRPKAYLYKVAVRLWRRRSQTECLPPADHLLENTADPHDALADVDLADMLVRWFRQLPEQQRRVAGLRLIAGLSELQTAEVLGVSLGTVKSQLHDARKRLKQMRDHDRDTWGDGR